MNYLNHTDVHFLHGENSFTLDLSMQRHLQKWIIYDVSSQETWKRKKEKTMNKRWNKIWHIIEEGRI